MRARAVLARELVYEYPEEGVKLVKLYDDLKKSRMQSAIIPLKLNHGGPVIGQCDSLEYDDKERKLLIAFDYEAKNISDPDLLQKLQKGEPIAISGEFESTDIMKAGALNNSSYDGIQTDITWTGAALIHNSNQQARCPLPKCGVNIDAHDHTLAAPLVIKHWFDGILHNSLKKEDSIMEQKLKELETQIAQITKEKQDAITAFETYKKQQAHNDEVAEVAGKTGIKADALKDFCHERLQGVLDGFNFAKAQGDAPKKDAQPMIAKPGIAETREKDHYRIPFEDRFLFERGEK